MHPLTLQAAQLSYDLARYGGASADTVIEAGRELTSAQQATESLDERAFRLGVAAADKDHQAERDMKDAADLAGMAAGRRSRCGTDDETAAILQRRSDIATAQAVKAQDAAFALKLERAGVIAEMDILKHVSGVARLIARVA